jgi:putative flavoprotein involved in K+ transport
VNTSRTTDVVVIGGGQAGLAMSHCLTRRGIDHVVLERGDTANSWRTQRWDSLRLLTPNWLSRLPGWSYQGDDPDGYMTAAEVANHLDAYRRSFDAPVRHGTTVVQVASSGSQHLVTTDDGDWRARAVVLATGACSDPHIPAVADEMPLISNICHRSTTGIPISSSTAACSWWAPRPPDCRSPTSWPAPVGR